MTIVRTTVRTGLTTDRTGPTTVRTVPVGAIVPTARTAPTTGGQR
jgi:hypothetical protein